MLYSLAGMVPSKLSCAKEFTEQICDQSFLDGFVDDVQTNAFAADVVIDGVGFIEVGVVAFSVGGASVNVDNVGVILGEDDAGDENKNGENSGQHLQVEVQN
jgi:hypothetical protein